MTKKTLIVFILLSMFLICFSQQKDSLPLKRNPFEMMDQKVPAFSGTSLSGKQWSNDSLKGKVTVFTFWYIGCAGCMYEINSLNILNKEYKNKDFVLLSLAPQVKEDLQAFNDTSKSIHSMLRNMFNAKPIEYEIIPTCDARKPKSEAATLQLGPECDLIEKDFKVWGHPVLFIADKNGIIRYIHQGFASGAKAESLLNTYRKEIDELLNK